MVYLYVYLAIFVIVSVIFVLLKSSKENEINFLNDWIQHLPGNVFPVLKGIPAISAALFVFLTMPEVSLFFILVIAGLIFCLFGDLGIMKNLLLGLVLFLVAHILLIIAYSSQILIIGSQLLVNETIIVGGALFALMTLIDVLFYRYLRGTKEPEVLQKMKIPVIIYMILISLHVITAGVLAYNLFPTSMGIIVILIGSASFFFSDAMIAVDEFHHKLTFRELIVMPTYYFALLCISLITQVWLF